MSQKFRTISHAVVAGRKFNDLAKNQKNVTYFMEADGSAHVCTLSDDEKDNGLTPLMLAARDNKHNIVEKLLELGAVTTDRDKEGRSALHYAAVSGSEGIVKLLLSKRADGTLTGGPDEQLALHMACSRPSGALEIVRTLLKVSGKDPKLATDKNGSTPLFLAIMVGNQHVVKELLSTQAEQQVKINIVPSEDTVLHAAVRKRDVDIAKLLVECGCPVDVQNAEGQTALHIAAYEGDETMIKFLQTARVDANIADANDRTPLHLAAERGHSNVAEFLVDKLKANVNMRTKDGSTLMHIASQAGHPDTTLVFLKKGVPLHMPNKDGAVCLHAAARKGHVGVVKALLSKGASVDTKTKDQYTALHIAVKYCKPQVVQILLGYGANVQLKGGKAEETPLHIAARIKDGDKVAEMLIKSGADVNAASDNGETAVHVAARFGNLKTLKLLINEKADTAKRSKVFFSGVISALEKFSITQIQGRAPFNQK